MIKYNLQNLSKISAALQSVGLSGNQLLLALAQVAHETGGFNDKKIQTHNNPAGITFVNNKTKQPNASKGNPLPENKKYFYAKFTTLKDWAKDYIRLVGNKLKSSSSAADFANKLKAGNYYKDTIKNYSTALSSHLKNLLNIIKSTPPKDNKTIWIVGLIAAAILIKKIL